MMPSSYPQWSTSFSKSPVVYVFLQVPSGLRLSPSPQWSTSFSKSPVVYVFLQVPSGLRLSPSPQWSTSFSKSPVVYVFLQVPSGLRLSPSSDHLGVAIAVHSENAAKPSPSSLLYLIDDVVDVGALPHLRCC